MLPVNPPAVGQAEAVDYLHRLRAALAAPAEPGVPRTAVVVVNYGSHQLLAANLRPGLAEAAGVRIVVVDNYSTGSERESVAALAAERGWELVAPDGNLGFGEGVNLGVLRGAELGCRVFVTLNPDALASAAVLAELGRAVSAAPAALVSPLVARPDGSPFFRGSTIDMRTGRIRTGWIPGDDDPVWKNWLSGACIAFSGAAFAQAGGYADGYFLYWEDVELSRRAADRGLELQLRDDLSVVHDEGGTHTARNRRAKSPLYYYFNTRNRLLFAARVAAPADRRSWLLSTPRESLRIWLRGGRRQLLTEPQGMLAALRGTLAGLREYRRALRKQHRDHPQPRQDGAPGG